MSLAKPRGVQSRETAGLAVLVFAKAPVPGRCKTRLARGCHPRRAARIHRALVENAIASVRAQATTERVCLVCAPSITHPLFKRLARDYGVALQRQVQGDLGARMHAAVGDALKYHRAVILMGSDQPVLDDGWLASARATLDREDRLWLAPTTDGGYWAIGVSRPAARLFLGMAWSTPRVARMTRRRADRCGLDVVCWPKRADVDTWRDWCRLERSKRAEIAHRAVMPRAPCRPRSAHC